MYVMHLFAAALITCRYVLPGLDALGYIACTGESRRMTIHGHLCTVHDVLGAIW
jgi:hypothetical protein